jgi:hypothetical protein
MFFHETQARKLREALGVEFGLEGAIELREALVVGKGGELQAGGVAPSLHDAILLFEDEIKELSVAEPALLGSIDEIVCGFGQTEELELKGVALDALGDHLSHLL